mmetsp:Transcript_43184/g.89926  ORF Transcript_43184/g.89926 Transcript_43184/m.89926 type:complete len:283 (-) Transcript_43184:265-1113(-)
MLGGGVLGSGFLGIVLPLPVFIYQKVSREGGLDPQPLRDLDHGVLDPSRQRGGFGSFRRRVSVEVAHRSKQQKYASRTSVVSVILFREVDCLVGWYLKEIVQRGVSIELFPLGREKLDHLGIGFSEIGAHLHGFVALYRPEKVLASPELVLPGTELSHQRGTEAAGGRKAPFPGEKTVVSVLVGPDHRSEGGFDVFQVFEDGAQFVSFRFGVVGNGGGYCCCRRLFCCPNGLRSGSQDLATVERVALAFYALLAFFVDIDIGNSTRPDFIGCRHCACNTTIQ